MTIRDYVERRGRLAHRVTIWSIVGVIFGLLLWETISKKTAPDVNVALPVAILLMLFPVIEYLKRTKCPRCGGDLSRLASRAMSRNPLDENSCPHCGVSLDEPSDGPLREPMLDRIVTIRKIIQARSAKFSHVLYVSLPLVFYGIFVAPKWSASQVVTIALSVVITVVLGVFVNRTPCPKCGRALGTVASRVVRPGRGAKCKTCGTDIDAPLYNRAG